MNIIILIVLTVAAVTLVVALHQLLAGRRAEYKKARTDAYDQAQAAGTGTLLLLIAAVVLIVIRSGVLA